MIKLIDRLTESRFLLTLYFTNPVDTFSGTIFCISEFSLLIPGKSKFHCKINEIKGMEFHNYAQSSLDAQQDD